MFLVMGGCRPKNLGILLELRPPDAPIGHRGAVSKPIKCVAETAAKFRAAPLKPYFPAPAP